MNRAAEPEPFDAVVIGGGLAGLTAAIALGRGGLEVACVDALDPAAAVDAGFDGRVSALSYGSVRMLDRLGLWAHMAAHAQPIRDIVVSDGRLGEGPGPLTLHFDTREIGEPALGYIVENRVTRLALQAVAADTARLTLIAPDAASQFDLDSPRARVALKSGRHLAARLLIGADGRDSAVRAAAGIAAYGWSYDQAGIVTTVAHEKPHQGIAHEYFLPGGPFAILPMTGNRSSLVWTEPTEVARAIVQADERRFREALARRFGDFLGAHAPEGPRFSYPLSLQIARDFAAPRVALIGDAAHVIHPIAGQGLNLGLRDAAALCETVLGAARLGLDFGSAHVLADYARWRRADTAGLALATDALNRLFSNDVTPLRLLRDAGMWASGQVPALRRFFMREAGGVTGRLPELMRA